MSSAATDVFASAAAKLSGPHLAQVDSQMLDSMDKALKLGWVLTTLFQRLLEIGSSPWPMDLANLVKSWVEEFGSLLLPDRLTGLLDNVEAAHQKALGEIIPPASKGHSNAFGFHADSTSQGQLDDSAPFSEEQRNISAPASEGQSNVTASASGSQHNISASASEGQPDGLASSDQLLSSSLPSLPSAPAPDPEGFEEESPLHQTIDSSAADHLGFTADHLRSTADHLGSTTDLLVSVVDFSNVLHGPSKSRSPAAQGDLQSLTKDSTSFHANLQGLSKGFSGSCTALQDLTKASPCAP
ncbi:hypothetical protein CRENBAI_021014 [Crenichthys baileyi]|uniref:Uncharacterized protein n=1 Tax=Crenichthys baileyi TaxID=28760 RepID=A0AAV9QU32_9TELE